MTVNLDGKLALQATDVAGHDLHGLRDGEHRRRPRRSLVAMNGVKAIAATPFEFGS